jgi:hypothetical protein
MKARGVCVVPALAFTLVLVPGAGGGGPLVGSINLVNRTWVCRGPVNLTAVTVTITTVSDQKDAVHLTDGCTGSIGKIDVVLETVADGIKVGEGAHDLMIGGGTIQCLARADAVHQDGVQVMGGVHVRFVGLDVECLSANNSDFFIRAGSTVTKPPTDVVCSGCRFLATPTDPTTGKATGGPSSTVTIADSVRSGVVRSFICPGHYFQLRITTTAVYPVNRYNTLAKTC